MKSKLHRPKWDKENEYTQRTLLVDQIKDNKC